MAFNHYKRKSPSYESDADDGSEFLDSDSDFDVASVATNKSQKIGSSTSARGQGSIQRKPTRIPNPKVSNRNALLARENRLRKKQYVEELEQEIEAVKLENKKLRQMMKKKNGEITKLEMDRTYLKSILVNKTEIFSLLKTVQNTRIPIANAYAPHRPTPSVNDHRRNSLHGSHSSFSSASPVSEERNDFGLAMTPQSINGWDTLLSDCQPEHVYCTAQTADAKFFSNTKIESEHNYFETDQKTDTVAPKPGICLCAACHQQAQQSSWIDDEEL